jgi:hypothetical protein
VVLGEVRGRRRSGRERRQVQLGEPGAVAHRAVGDEPGHAPAKQAGGEDVAERRRPRPAPGVDDEHRTGRHRLDGLALRVVVVLEDRQRVQVLP